MLLLVQMVLVNFMPEKFRLLVELMMNLKDTQVLLMDQYGHGHLLVDFLRVNLLTVGFNQTLKFGIIMGQAQ